MGEESMNHCCRCFAAALWGASLFATAGFTAEPESGYRLIFDGKSLDDWDGNPKLWRVEENAITGKTIAEDPTKGISSSSGEEGNLEFRTAAPVSDARRQLGHSVPQLGGRRQSLGRGWISGRLRGRQTHTPASSTASGTGASRDRGQQMVIGSDHKPQVIGPVGESDEIQTNIKMEDWNDYEVKAQGFEFTHVINGVVTSRGTDEDEEHRREDGVLALQLHVGPPMKVQFRNIRLKEL